MRRFTASPGVGSSKNVDENAAKQVASAYRSVYERTPSTFDGAVTSADYLQRMEEAYPLHPELLDVIYKKWSTASDFPRTRRHVAAVGERRCRPVAQSTAIPT